MKQKLSTYATSCNGFTLIELMITVAVIGILATLATGSFLSYQAKAKQAEVKNNLGTIGKLAESYRAEYDTYDTDWNGLGWLPNFTTRYRYWYNGQSAPNTPTSPEIGVNYSDPGSAVSSNGSSFTAAAVGNIDYDLSSDQILYNSNRQFTTLQNDILVP